MVLVTIAKCNDKDQEKSDKLRRIRYKMSKAPETDLQLKEDFITNKSNREFSDGSPRDCLEKLRLLCLCRGVNGFLVMGRTLRKLDHNGYRSLSVEEFIKGLNDIGVCCAYEEGEELFDRFDTDGGGTINMTEFLAALRPSMSSYRLEIIDKAFEKLDRNHDGAASLADFQKIYKVASYPGYETGEYSKDEILSMFLANFEDDPVIEGKVTKEEFINYYSGVSATIEEDTYFDLMMRQIYTL